MTLSSTLASTPAGARYTSVAIFFHWLAAMAIFSLVGIGLYMVKLPVSPLSLKLYNWHKWLGVSFLLLSTVRLLWRLTHRPPALPHIISLAMPAWQVQAHHAVHHVLYAMFFVVPLIGWAYSSAAGYPVVWLGLVQLPDLLSPNRALAEMIKPLHGLSAFTLLALTGVHVAAAVKHQWVDRDGLLTRMLPGRT